MSRIVPVYTLSGHQQDNLWIENQCPYCASEIIEHDENVDYAYWKCVYCDAQFIVE